MEYRILGRLAALDDHRDVAPSRAQPRALLAIFLLHPNERVSTDRLIEALWGESPPPTADKALQGHVSVLRKLLGATRIRTEGGAYRLEVRPGELDADRLAEALASARSTADAGARARILAEGLALWRGEPLAEFASARFAQLAIGRLEDLRLAVAEAHAEAALELGQHSVVVGELEPLVARNPLNEGLRAKLMLALYRSGRQADALRVFREGRRVFAEELGIDPGAELRRLEHRILEQDPTLALAPIQEPVRATRQERKVVTVLVAEIVPSRATDPEELDGLVGPAGERARSIIERHGGIAEPLFANGVLGVFGAPRAHDDDALRAIRAGLELRDLDGTEGIRTRTGIESGDALVTIDPDDRVSVTGEVLAAASGLQARAAVGSIVVGRAAHRATAAVVDYRDVGADAWSPAALRGPTQPNASETTFVGRAAELELLERIFVRVRDERAVQLVTITAEPGGGKSRLVREFRARLESWPNAPVWRQGRCLPYGDGITYWAFGAVVKSQAGILESDDADTSRHKLAAAVATLEPDESRRRWLEANLTALVGIEGTTATGDREQAFAAWLHLIEAVATPGPLVVAFEDIHWADTALLQLIEHLVRHATSVPLLVLCTARLELLAEHPAWGAGIRNATSIALEPLSGPDTQLLLRALLGREPDPDTARRAGGNPLFAHELAWMARQPPGDDAAPIPDSLQSVIAARLDALSPDLKAVTSDAGVFGEVFWSGAVAAMGGLDPREADARLQRLVASDVVRRRRSSTVERQSEYEFLHVLVRDVAYRQIPRRERIAKHRAAGLWIEQLAGDRVVNHAELIAHHYTRALEIARGLAATDDVDDLLPRARSFLFRAGEATRMVDLAQAESLYRRALDLTGQGDTEHGRLLARLGELSEITGRVAEAEQLLAQAVEELQANGDELGAGEAMTHLAATMWRLGRPEPKRRRLGTAAIRTLEALPPGPALVLAYSQMAKTELTGSRNEACAAWSGKALALAQRLGQPALEVVPRNNLGILRFESGDEAGIDDIREAARIGRDAGLSLETATALTNVAATVWVSDGPVAALALKREAAEFAASRGLQSLERTIQAEALWQLHDAGAWDEALVSAEQLIAAEGREGSSRVQTMARTVKARILADRGRTDEAGDVEREFLPRARELRDPQDLGPALAAAAARQMSLGDARAAAELIVELERITRGRGPSQRTHELPHAARVCLAAGRIDVAEALIPRRGAPTYRRGPLCLESARAIVAEAHGYLDRAANLHAAVADGWRAFGNPAEAAHALLGAGRCLVALGRATDARPHLHDARDLARNLSARPLERETERLLGETS